MGAKVSAERLNNVPSLDEYLQKLKAKYFKVESDFYEILMRLTRDINELSNMILELDDFKVELDLNEFDSQF
tara:strand:- start:6822 stop:7037 length:216 start_codon:yes stop_codon:yes gene_type:complete